MISDQSDEDADTLDDDKLLAAYLGLDPQKPAQAVTATQPSDWPPATEHAVGLSIDNITLDWFKANHTDWQRQMRFVLRAWVVAQTVQADTPSDPNTLA